MGNRGGTMNADVADIVDVTPTLLDLAHVTPATSKEPIDGISIAGVFKGQKIERNAPPSSEHSGPRGIPAGRGTRDSLAPPGPGNKAGRAAGRDKGGTYV